MADYTYDAFGNQTEASGDTNPFRYSGEYYDEETGLIYLRARYYDAGVGAFTSADTHWNVGNMIYGDDNTGIPSIAAIMQSGNLYVYCGGNPVNLWDVSGCNWFQDSYNRVKNAFNVIGEKANRTQKAAQRAVWAAGAELYLRKQKDYQTSAWMLEHALQDNPSDIYRGNDSRIAYLINHDNNFSKEVSKAMIKSNGSLNNVSIGVAFNTGDLYYSIHKSTINLTGYKRNDGSWIIHCVLTDTFDFTEIQSFMSDDGSFQWDASLGTIANDAAYISQKTGAINPYKVTVDFWITR